MQPAARAPLAARAWVPVLLLVVLLGTGGAQAAAAASGAPVDIVASLRPFLLDWRFDPLAVIVGGGLAWAYLRGLARAYRRDEPVADWRPVAILTALVLWVLALVSPIVVLADHLYWLRQAQIAAIRIVAPFLFFAALPQRELYFGLPKRVRLGLLAPLRHSPRWHALRPLRHPLAVSVLFVALFYLGQAPVLQDAVQRWAAPAYLLNLIMIATGALFFFVLFDPRDPPEGASYGGRMMMLVVASFSQILLGVGLTLKPMVIYSAYGLGPRLFGMSALDDEAAGGFLNWAPVCFILLICVFVLFSAWNRAEARYWARMQSGRGGNLRVPETAEELWMMVAPKNRRVGLSLAIVPFVMMGLAIATVVGAHYYR